MSDTHKEQALVSASHEITLELVSGGCAILELEPPETFVFVRDPRASVAELAGGMDVVPIGEWVQSPQVVGLHRECQRLADFCRERRHVKVVRLEDLPGDRTRLASALVEMLGLRISSAAALRVVASITGMAASQSSYLERFDRASRVVLDETFADVLAFFGYLPEAAPSPVFFEHWSEFQRAIRERLSVAGMMSAPAGQETGNAVRRASVSLATRSDSQARAPAPQMSPGLTEPDPELLWRLRPNGQDEMTVLGRHVTMEADRHGCRPVLGQPTSGEKTLAVYGCSLTFGRALPYEETFCSVLQSMLPRWRVENYGTSGYSTVQNLIQLRRNSRWSTPDYVTFCFFPDHRLRNVGDISYRRKLMGSPLSALRQQMYPRAALAPDGRLAFRYVKHPRWDLDSIDLSDLRNDDFYLDLVTASLFERACEIVKQSGGQFFVTTLWGEVSPALRRRLSDAGIPVLNASVQGKEFTCLPDDGHPNARANRVYAERLRDYLMEKSV